MVPMMNHEFLWAEGVEESEIIEGYQQLIDTGQAWLFEGSVGSGVKCMEKELEALDDITDSIAYSVAAP